MNIISWHPDVVSVAQFAGRVRQYLGGAGVIFTPEMGWEYRIDAGRLYRARDGQWMMSVGEAMQMDDATLVARLKEEIKA